MTSVHKVHKKDPEIQAALPLSMMKLTQDEDLHPCVAQPPGVDRHGVLGLPNGDDHGHLGETRSGAGRLAEAVLHNVVQGRAWTERSVLFLLTSIVEEFFSVVI